MDLMKPTSKRGKNKIQHPYTMKDIYLDYISTINKRTPYYVSFLDFCELSKMYCTRIINKIVLESKSFKIPFRLGRLFVSKKKPKILSDSTLSVDWLETRKAGKIIRHINDHSNGYKYRFTWSKKTAFVINQTYYRLVLSRDNKRFLARTIKTGDVDYIEC